MNIKLNIKSIIKFEQFTNKSFNEIDYTNTDDLMKLLYCIVLSNNPELFTYDEFIELSNNKKISKEITEKFSKEIKLIELFTSKEVKEETTVEPTDKVTIYIKDIVALLIVNTGIDANYVMNEMEINDIPLYMTAYNNKVKEQMESSRLWTYLSILPHIDSTKINSPSKLYPFPWEIEIQQKEEKAEFKSMADELPDLFKAGAELMEKINKQKQEYNG